MKKTLSSVIFLSVILVLFQGCKSNGEDNVAKMESIEMDNLYKGIQGFVGNSWNGSDLYPDPCGWTPIQGVSCDLYDGFWYVTDLNIGPLHDNSLTCSENPEFRPQIFDLKYLKSLSFYNCFSSHKLFTLPTNKWSTLATTLESLEFRSNPSLTGAMPSTFGDLQKLQSLVLIENGFSDNLPLSIGNLRHLKRLVLSGNKFTGSIIDTLGNLNELLILDLSRNLLSGYIPSSIGYLKSLIKLDLSNNLLMGSIPNEMGNLQNLTLLDLSSNNFSNGLTTSLEEMTSLQELVLARNQIGGEMVDLNWEKMQNLVVLDVSNAGLLGNVPKSMSKLKNLRYLGLSNNNLTGNLPTEIAEMPRVSSIYVDGNNLTGILNFSEGFYGRLGRRFKAWDNPNLCYIGGLISSGHVPIGVDPCTSDKVTGISGSNLGIDNESGKLQERSEWMSSSVRSKSLEPDSNGSFGLLRHETWLVFLVEFLTMILFWN